MVWDSFFALVMMFTIVWVPLAIVFTDSFHNAEDSINWVAFELFFHGLWLVAFAINLNRVDFVKKIISFGQTSEAYFFSPFLVPDAVALIGAVACTISGNHLTAKYFELIRLFHYNDALYPVYFLVRKYSNTGKKRIS